MSDPKTITLRGGRTLGYREYGDPDGAPVVNCHGGTLCGLDLAAWSEAARALGVRVVSPDRPGLGESTAVPGRTTSSPVETMATRNGTKQSTSATPSEANAASSCGRNTAPASSTVAPPATSSPAFLTFAPGRRPAGMATVVCMPAAPTTASSCMATVSCPCGSTAPVNMRTAVARSGVTLSAWPAAARPDTASTRPFSRS